MITLKKIGCHIALLLLMHTTQGCAGNQQQEVLLGSGTAVVKKPVAYKSEGDIQLFKTCLAKFKNVVKVKNKVAITALFNFPLQTLPQWTNDELNNSAIIPQDGMLNQAEFLTYFDEIFTKDAARLIVASKEDDLSEIEKDTPENYYTTLKKVTDKGSALFELQKQYVQDNGKETSFGFVFGKVRGAYKVISYYRPWPLK